MKRRIAASIILILFVLSAIAVSGRALAAPDASPRERWRPVGIGVRGDGESDIPGLSDAPRGFSPPPFHPRAEVFSGYDPGLVPGHRSLFVAPSSDPGPGRGAVPGLSWTLAWAETEEDGTLRLTPVDLPDSLYSFSAMMVDRGLSPRSDRLPRSVPMADSPREIPAYIPNSRPGPMRPLVVLLDEPEEIVHSAGIYAGRGSWDENVIAVENFLGDRGFETTRFGGEGAGDETWDFDLMWFPGGFSAEYRAYGPDPEKVREFVREGGIFVGSCAGAYYASSVTVWNGVAREQPLALFFGRAVGPVSALGPWGTTTPVIAGEDLSRWVGEPPEMYYMDGPELVPDDPGDAQVLAVYEATGRPAIVAADYGEGRVLLVGPHPELGFDDDSGSFDLEGTGGAVWDWLYELLVRHALPGGTHR